jgi:hypothetical protein
MLHQPTECCACLLLQVTAVRDVGTYLTLRCFGVVVIYLVVLSAAECGEWQLALTAGVSGCVGGCCYG